MYKEVEPMLAAEEKKDITTQLLHDPNWLAEEKYNGCRYVAHFCSDRLYFTSRHYSKNDPSKHVEKGLNIPHLNIVVPQLIGTVLDGEICKPGKISTSYKVTKFMGADPDKAIAYQKQYGFGCYRVWDIISYKGQDLQSLPLLLRKQHLSIAVQEWTSKLPQVKPYIHLVLGVTNDKDLFLDTIMKQGGEGIVLKQLNQPYVQNGRNRDYWMKVKQEQTWDCIVTGYEPPEQYTIKKGDTKPTLSRLWINKWIGTICFGMYKNGILVPVGKCSGMPDKVRQAISAEPNRYIGKVIEVKGQCMTEAGAIQNPRYIGFREDKDAKDCKV